MMWSTFRRFGVTSLLVTAIIGTAALPAWAVSIDDPDIFGPGEAWDLPGAIEPGDSGPWVERLQNRLADAGFRPGPSDARFGKMTLGAVYAFQKVHELPRDGVFRAEHWDLLDVAISLPATTVEDPNRIEIDLADQVLYLIKDDSIEVVLPISSANGDTYRGRGGSLVRARTPEGTFKFDRHIQGWRISYLGGLYYPYYFYGGYALHGSWSVPPYPASHGCVRVEIHDMNYLLNELSLGMSVHVYGNTLERSDLLPSPPPRPSEYLPTAVEDQLVISPTPSLI